MICALSHRKPISMLNFFSFFFCFQTKTWWYPEAPRTDSHSRDSYGYVSWLYLCLIYIVVRSTMYIYAFWKSSLLTCRETRGTCSWSPDSIHLHVWFMTEIIRWVLLVFNGEVSSRVVILSLSLNIVILSSRLFTQYLRSCCKIHIN